MINSSFQGQSGSGNQYQWDRCIYSYEAPLEFTRLKYRRMHKAGAYTFFVQFYQISQQHLRRSNILTVCVPDAPMSNNVSVYDLGVSACHNRPMGIKI